MTIPLSLLPIAWLHGAVSLVLTQSGHKTDISHPHDVRYVAVLRQCNTHALMIFYFKCVVDRAFLR